MRKHIMLLLIIGCTMGAGLAYAAKKQSVYMEEEKSDAWEQAEHKTKGCGSIRHPIRVGGFVTNPPFGWVDATREANYYSYKNAGFSYDLFTKLAKNLNLRTKNIGFPSFAEAILALRKGQIDVLTGSYYDRRVLGVGTTLLFPGYFKNQIIIVFLKGKEKPVRSFADLAGIKGVVRQEENLYSLIYQQVKGLPIEQVSGARKAFTKLIKGEVDYMITSLYAAEAEARRFKLTNDLAFTDYALIQPEMFFVFSANSECTNLRPRFAKALTEELKNQQAFFSTFLTYVDTWGSRFKNEPSLIEQIKKEEEEATKPKPVEPVETIELVEPTEPIEDTQTKSDEGKPETPAHS